ncbi:MAG: hypothetical protein E7324_04485 [Clostridiales bacterium]|nr:hypothetical protein [Clostridiales bacterium]
MYDTAAKRESWIQPSDRDTRSKKRARRQARSQTAQKQKGLCLWHKFVLLVGYAAILYAAARGVVALLVMLEGTL